MYNLMLVIIGTILGTGQQCFNIQADTSSNLTTFGYFTNRDGKHILTTLGNSIHI